jgi:hypothetical protein
MGQGVHIQVTIPIRCSPDEIKALASDLVKTNWFDEIRPLEIGSTREGGETEAQEFLTDLSEGNFHYKWGNEGDVLVWAMVGNWSNPDRFVDLLMPFWETVFDPTRKILPMYWLRILVVYSVCCGEDSGVFEIGWSCEDQNARKIEIRRFPHQEFRCL